MLPCAQVETIAWQFLLAARRLSMEVATPVYLSYDKMRDRVFTSDQPDETTCLFLNEENVWCCSSHIPDVFRAMFDLYFPILGNRATGELVVAHLGQSIDSQIATISGDSFFVTGEQNRKHLHCLRALSDAVVVGASTVQADDPQLTTRAVPGQNPVRVVIDPHARLQGTLGIFNDGQAKTVLIHQSSAELSGMEMQFGPSLIDSIGNKSPQVERWVVPDTNTQLPVEKIITTLASNNLKRIFIEGGGITVSRFFEADCLDRLHVAVAPILVGQGTQALQIAGSEKMINARRPPFAIYRMGEDVLWDFDVRDLDANHRADESLQADSDVENDQPSVQRIL